MSYRSAPTDNPWLPADIAAQTFADGLNPPGASAEGFNAGDTADLELDPGLQGLGSWRRPARFTLPSGQPNLRKARRLAGLAAFYDKSGFVLPYEEAWPEGATGPDVGATGPVAPTSGRTVNVRGLGTLYDTDASFVLPHEEAWPQWGRTRGTPAGCSSCGVPTRTLSAFNMRGLGAAYSGTVTTALQQADQGIVNNAVAALNDAIGAGTLTFAQEQSILATYTQQLRDALVTNPGFLAYAVSGLQTLLAQMWEKYNAQQTAAAATPSTTASSVVSSIASAASPTSTAASATDTGFLSQFSDTEIAVGVIVIGGGLWMIFGGSSSKGRRSNPGRRRRRKA
jgi:hypothetical protein